MDAGELEWAHDLLNQLQVIIIIIQNLTLKYHVWP